MPGLMKPSLLFLAVLLCVRGNHDCKTNSFNHVAVELYSKFGFGTTLNVSQCFSPSTLCTRETKNKFFLFCRKQKIPHLRQEAIAHLQHLEKIVIDGSEVVTIEKKAFRNLPSLLQVFLQDNKIEFLEDGVFSNVSNLRSLYLKRNNLEYFEQDWLGDVPNLKNLDLSHNLLKYLPRESFVELKSLAMLHLGDNQIRYISRRAFEGLPNLETLDLSYNRVARLHDDLFVATANLRHLALHNNNLTYLSDESLETFKHLRDLVLLSNPWLCGCHEKIAQWAGKHENVHLADRYSVVCQKSPDLKNIPVCVVTNETGCVPDYREDLLGVLQADDRYDYGCSYIKTKIIIN